jgi:uncharacterized protein YndB with AHSA1/START domain
MSRTDTAKRIVNASPAAIYRAFIDPEALVQWLPPDGMSGQMLAFDPRPGGRYCMTLRYEDASIAGKSGGNEDTVEARFVDLIPNERIMQAVDFVSDDPRFAGTMTMSWILTPRGQATEVSIIAENVPPGISKQDHDEGINSSLANLARFVEGGS